MDLERAIGAAGLAIRAGKAVSGIVACEKAIQSGKAMLVIMDPSVGPNTGDRMRNLCASHHVSLAVIPKEDAVENLTGKPNRKTLVILDQRFAEMIINHLQEQK